MLSDYDVRRCSKVCAASELHIEPGEIYYSVLHVQGAETVRMDYRADSWKGPPEACLGWWRSRLPTAHNSKPQLAPRDVLVNLLIQLADIPSEMEFRYVLSLVMLRRRILRYQDSNFDDSGKEWMDLYCPHREQQLDVQVAAPDSERSIQLQQRLIELLHSGQEITENKTEQKTELDAPSSDTLQSSQNNSKPPSLPTGMGAALLVLWLFCCTGATCSHSLRNPFASLGPTAPEILPAEATLEQILGAVNQNTARIRSYSTNNASISVPGMPAIPLLRGNLVAQRPQRFRMIASTGLTGREVDLGTNDELFWFWVKSNEPPAVYFSRHDQFVGSAAQQTLPVEPAWFMSALGMVEFRSTDFHEGPRPRGNGTVEIRSVVNTATGKMTRSTIIDVKRAWVLQQHLYDQAGTLLASAIANSHRYYPDFGLSLPQKIEIRLPPVQLALSIHVGTVQLNSLVENPGMWEMPVISGSPQMDLSSPGTIATPAAAVAPIPALSNSTSPPLLTRSVYQTNPRQLTLEQPDPRPPLRSQPQQLPAAGIPVR
ncbi:MAG: hypothetical protein ABGX16_16695 [Pirellulales bacterium]